VVPKKSFPGYEKCLALMRKHDPELRERGFHLLRPHAADHVEALLADFVRESDHGLRCWLLELIGDAQSPLAFDLLSEQLRSSDDAFQDWAARGLRALDTPEARALLFHAGVGKSSSRCDKA
jgi:hypothetical protein